MATNSNGVKQYGDLTWGTGESDVMQGVFTWSWAGKGGSYMIGNGGDDQMWGTTLRDTLHGGAGNDLLIGDDGSDSLQGGSGSDIFRFSTGDGHDVIDDLNWTDKIVFKNVDPDDVMVVATGNKMEGPTGYAIVYGEGDQQGTIQLNGVNDSDLPWVEARIEYMYV